MIKRLCICCILFFAVAVGVRGQCIVPQGFVCLTQVEADKASALADKYVALKAALETAQKEIAVLQTSNADLKALVDAQLKELGIDTQIRSQQTQLQMITDAIVKAQADWIAQLEKKISNNKSFLQKLLVKLQVAYYILAGIAIVTK